MRKFNEIMEDKTFEKNDYLKKIFCNNLKDLRKEKGLSQQEIAEKLGRAVSTYANWEQGRREPDIFDIYCLLWVFDTDANELFSLEDLI